LISLELMAAILHLGRLLFYHVSANMTRVSANISKKLAQLKGETA
jgi:uncharacterized membrane protein